MRIQHDTTKAREVVKALKANTTLTRLVLEGNELGSEGGASVAEALKANTTLTSRPIWWSSAGRSSYVRPGRWFARPLRLCHTRSGPFLPINSFIRKV